VIDSSDENEGSGSEDDPTSTMKYVAPLSCDLYRHHDERKAKRMALDKIRKLALWDPLPPFFALLVQPVDDNGREDPEWRCSVGDSSICFRAMIPYPWSEVTTKSLVCSCDNS
jgi:hypothetical protein